MLKVIGVRCRMGNESVDMGCKLGVVGDLF